jgi:hypothetical protein
MFIAPRAFLFLMSPFMGGRIFRSSGAGVIIRIWFYKHFAATRLWKNALLELFNARGRVWEVSDGVRALSCCAGGNRGELSKLA